MLPLQEMSNVWYDLHFKPLIVSFYFIFVFIIFLWNLKLKINIKYFEVYFYLKNLT